MPHDTSFSPDHGDRQPDGPKHKNLRPLLKAAFFFLSLVALIIFVRIFDLQGVLEPGWADSHLDFSADSDVYKSVLLYLSLVAVLSPLGIPRQALSALGGYAFGAFYGTLFASIGLGFGCAAGFFYSRILARPALGRRFGNRVQRLEDFLSCNPFIMTMTMRFFPLGNNALLNLAAGVTRIPAPAFIAGSFIGYMPQTVIFALLGSGIRIDPLWRTTVSALLFVAASGLGFMLYRKFKGEQALIRNAKNGASREEEAPSEQDGSKRS